MKNKIIIFLLISLFILQIFSPCLNAEINSDLNIETVEVITKNYDNEHNKEQEIFACELSYDEAIRIKEKLIDLESSYTGLDKIRAQIDILDNYNFLPENFSIDSLLSFINEFDSTNPITKRSFHLGFLIGGPMIVSHLTLGGRIKGVSILPPFLYSRRIFNITGPFNRTFIDQVKGLLLTYIGFCFRPVYITAIGIRYTNYANNIFFPFFEILTPAIGTSIAFNFKSKLLGTRTLFEYNLDLCCFGILGGFTF